MIGAPVSFTCCPLTRPSVASIEMVLTVFSPRCCATSRTTRDEPLGTVTSNAFKIGGSVPSNCTAMRKLDEILKWNVKIKKRNPL